MSALGSTKAGWCAPKLRRRRQPNLKEPMKTASLHARPKRPPLPNQNSQRQVRFPSSMTTRGLAFSVSAAFHPSTDAAPGHRRSTYNYSNRRSTTRLVHCGQLHAHGLKRVVDAERDAFGKYVYPLSSCKPMQVPKHSKELPSGKVTTREPVTSAPDKRQPLPVWRRREGFHVLLRPPRRENSGNLHDLPGGHVVRVEERPPSGDYRLKIKQSFGRYGHGEYSVG